MFLLSAVFVSTAIAGSKWILNDIDSGGNLGGTWGTWMPKLVCPEDKRIALGMRLLSESKQGKHKDDTAANGIQICCQKDLSDYNKKDDCDWIGSEGPWGDWQSPVFCPENTTIIGFKQRIEKFQGGLKSQDDTALNGLMMKCNDGTKKMVYEGNWGDWHDWVECPVDWYVAGIMSKIESNQGPHKDDTTMNQLSLMCQSPTVDRIVGQWVNVMGENDGGTYTVTTSVSLQHTNSASTTETGSISVSEEANFEFEGIGGGLTTTQSSSNSATNAVSYALTTGYSASTAVNCDDDVDERVDLWQWQMLTGYECSQDGMFGPKMLTPTYSCNPQSLPPLCDPYSCSDNLCRVGTDCIAEDEAMQHLEMVRKPSSAWRSDCCSLDTWTEACYSDKSAMNSFRPCKNMSCDAKCGSRGQTKHMPQCSQCCVWSSIEQDDIWRCKGKEAASKSEL